MNTRSYTIACDGKSWNASVTCVPKLHYCDGNYVSPTNAAENFGMIAEHNYKYGYSQGSFCGDTVAYRCRACGSLSVTPFPNPQEYKIVRTCLPNGLWSSPGGANSSWSFTCIPSYKQYTPNMLAYPGDRTRNEVAMSPFQCQQNVSLCTSCQTNIDARCAAQSLNQPAPGSIFRSPTALFKPCQAIARNRCPMKCSSQNITRLCTACDLSGAGLSYCAATGLCQCVGSNGQREGVYYGDGCQHVTEKLVFSTSSVANLCPGYQAYPFTASIPAEGPGKAGVRFFIKLSYKSDQTAVSSWDSAVTKTDYKISLPTQLQVNRSLQLNVTAVDLMKRQGSVLTKLFDFETYTWSRPDIQIEGNSQSSLLVSKTTMVPLAAVLKDPVYHPCTPNDTVQYSWSVTDSSNAKVAAKGMVTKRATLTIPKNTLSPGVTYTAVVTAQYGSNHLSATVKSQSLFVKVAEMFAAIREGSSFAVTKGDDVTLHVDVTDEDDVEKTYEWAAVDKDGSQVTISASSNSQLKVTTGSLSLAKSPFTFTCTVFKLSKKFKVAAASVITLSETPVPSVAISRNGAGEMQPNSYLSLTAIATLKGTPCVDCTFSWSCNQLNNMALLSKSLLPSLDSSTLTLKKNSLTAGSTYTFKLQAVTKAGGTGFSAVTVTVNSPPAGGDLTVSSPSGTNGIAFETPFTFTASGWSDTHLPLTYRFGYTLATAGNPTYPAEFGAVSSWVSKTLPIGSMKPCVLVRDAIGSITLFQSQKTITVEKMQPKAGESLSGALKKKMDSLLADASGDPAAAMEVVSGMASSINSDSDTTVAATAAAEAARATMASSLESSLSSPDVNPTSVMAAAAAIALKPTQLNEAAQASLKKAMVAVLDKVTELEPDAGQSVLSTLANVQSAAKPTTTAAKKADADAFAANMKSLTTKLSAAMVPGAPVAVLKTATVETQLQKNTAAEAVKKTIGGCKIKSFGLAQRRSAPPSIVTTSVIKTELAAIGYAYAPGGDLIKSQQVGLTILGDNNAELSMSNMSTPAEVAITVVSSIGNPQCVFYDTTQGAWLTTGLSESTSSADAKTITCKTSHLTDFAVQALPQTPPPPPPDLLSTVLSQSIIYGTITNWTGVESFYNEGYMKVAGYCASNVVRCNKGAYKYTGVGLSSTHSSARRSSTVVYTVKLVKSNAPSALSVSASYANALVAAIEAAAAAAGTSINVTVTNIAKAAASSANSPSPSPTPTGNSTAAPIASSSDGNMLVIILAVVGSVVVLGILGAVVGFMMTQSKPEEQSSKHETTVKLSEMQNYTVHPNKAVGEPEKVINVEIQEEGYEEDPEEQSTLLGASTAIDANKNVEDVILSVTGIPLSELDALVMKYFARYDIDGSGTLNTDDELYQLLVNLCYKVTCVSTAAGNLTHMTELVQQKSESVSLGDDNVWSVETFRAWFYDELILQKSAGYYGYPPMDKEAAATKQPKTTLRRALLAAGSKAPPI